MTTLGIIFGDSLFPNHTLVADTHVMIEDKGLCTHYKYHKHKLVLFLSAMRSHAKTLDSCLYYTLDARSYEEKLLDAIKQSKANSLVCYEISDTFMRERLKAFSKKYDLSLSFVATQSFLTPLDAFISWRKDRQLLMHHFYVWQRKRMSILLDQDNKPQGGKWSFDEENRKKIPKGTSIPPLPTFTWTKETKEVIVLVNKEFVDHPGDTNNFWLPTTREHAVLWMDDFFTSRFTLFGDYEDAIQQQEAFLFHSLLSPLLNCGLLTPQEVLDRALASDVPLNSKEGFIRQLIGWREFIRGVYHTEDFSGNYFSHERKLTQDWYEGTTGIEPVDVVIKRVLKYGFAHHIERLMILGNVMLLSEIHPDEVYRWFMELFVDSADWVMAPNVYGMSQFSDGGSFATKPYIGASNYVKKMSNFPTGDWCFTLDGLFWRFIQKNRTVFEQNGRMKFLLATLDRNDYTEKIQQAELFIKEKTK